MLNTIIIVKYINIKFNFKVIIEPKMSLKVKVQEMVGEQEEIVPHEVIYLKSLIIGYSFQI